LIRKALANFVEAIIGGKTLEVVREIDITINETPIKGTVKTKRKLL